MIFVLLTLGAYIAKFTYATEDNCKDKLASNEERLVHLIKKNEKCILLRISNCFEFFENLKKILSFKESSMETIKSLKVFNGVRVLSMGWIIFGHTFLFMDKSPVTNVFDLEPFHKNWKYATIISSEYAVDIFFMISGFLLCFGLQKQIKKATNTLAKIRLFLYVLANRYIRLLPVYLIVLFPFSIILPYLGNGPIYSRISFYNELCVSKWYYNLLYVNNFTDPLMKCAGHTWYLACDMQFFILIMIIFIIFSNTKLIRNIILLIIFLSSLTWSFLVSYWNKYNYRGENNKIEYTINFYISPLTRINPYILGVFFAELFLSIKLESNESNSVLFKVNHRIKKNNYLIVILFVLSIIMINYSVFINLLPYNIDNLSFLTCAIMNTLNKLVFVIGVAIILHLTYLGKFKFIKKFLSHNLFIPIGRLSYGIYMYHSYLIVQYFFSICTTQYFQFNDFLFLSFGFLICSIPITIILAALIESPIMNLTKLVMSKSNLTN